MRLNNWQGVSYILLYLRISLQINMKIVSFTLLWFLIGNVLYAQKKLNENSPTKEKIKSGWNFGALPTVTYDADRGFQYGALVNFFNYGDGSRYPKYNHSLYAEISKYTKGSGIHRFAYDSDRLLKGIRLTADVSYITEQALDLWGFNGYESVYNPSWEDEASAVYKTRMFYKYENKMFRLKADFQGKFGTSDFNWIAGFAFYHFKVGAVDLEKLNKNKEGHDLLPDTATLFDKYVDWNIIKADEIAGSWVNYLKVGLVYDTRDDRASPNKGMWTEAVIRYAPSFIGNNDYSHAKFTLTHRQYLPISINRLVFAYRITYQQTVGGNVPFYAQPILSTAFLTSATNQGLGGAGSLRGVLRNRVVGDGVLMGNFEMRYRFWNFVFFNQNIYVASNFFYDTGRVINPIELDLTRVPETEKADYFAQGNESFHNSMGAGLKVAMNHNFIMSIDYGKALDKRDGDSGVYIRLNYLF